jgi:hypothetical protein
MKTVARFVHHCIAHPMLFVTSNAPGARWLHDLTARLAWPRGA